MEDYAHVHEEPAQCNERPLTEWSTKLLPPINKRSKDRSRKEERKSNADVHLLE